MPHTAKSLMIQGTCSNAGKSLLVAGICRVLRRRGVRVAPFKAQNMSLNSFVTLAGEEIGRAQALQAQACGLEPEARMNPVLLKPNSQTGSQVIVMGRPTTNMEARAYFRHKPNLIATVHEAYDSLAREFDVIILEGAGSPAEINLKAHDIVNMNMARHAKSPVLIAADIDRGGAFAALIGTMACLEDWEQDLVAGFVLNKFRGDASLLSDALSFTSGRTGKPFFGTVPLLADLGLPEEDSVGFKENGFKGQRAKDKETLDICCVDLAHISNFTDLDPLDLEPDVRLRTVRSPGEIREQRPDAIILPGSKNTLGDLGDLWDTGVVAAIREYARSGGVVVGICGGFQMLGTRVCDPSGLESSASETSGLDLLPLETELRPDKILARSTFRHEPSGLAVSGYEIHHGETGTMTDGARPILFLEDTPVGYGTPNGNVWGSYLHGVFDNDAFRRFFLDELRAAKGLQPKKEIQARYDVGPGLDRLADTLTESLDWNALDRILEI
ncbi:MAG TPA: cobyric acid synthase [Desulfomicrobiaceae bacterium]|nr:cobyric acid synthase [Desulfomicrobiaceae bacterium]